MTKKRGQVWIETVIYTLIAISLIGLTLYFVKPKLEELKDKSAINGAEEILRALDSKIVDVGEGVVGERRIFEFKFSKGLLKINSSEDSIYFLIKSHYVPSEPGIIIHDGGLDILTTKKSGVYYVTIKKQYVNYNITYQEKEKSKTINPSPNIIKLSIENIGGENTTISISEI